MEFSRLSLFWAASLALLLTPGPAVLYIITRSVDQGRSAGLISVLSIETGNFFHVIAATLGLSALVLSSAMLFSIVKYLGAAYLIYLGIRKWFVPEGLPDISRFARAGPRRIFSQGVIVAVLNPKTALFFLAFLPQFVDVDQGNIPGQMLALGITFVLMACVTDSLYACLAGTAGQWVKGNWHSLRETRYLTGGIYIGLGLLTAFAETGRK
jgi:threonine/homoserine/homoserine lactone efflux protein